MTEEKALALFKGLCIFKGLCTVHRRRSHLPKLFQIGKGFKRIRKEQRDEGRVGMRACGTWEHKCGNTNNGVKEM